MSILKSTSKTQTFTLSIEDLKLLVEKDLGYIPKQIRIESVQKLVSSDPLDRFPAVYGFAGLKITVEE